MSKIIAAQRAIRVTYCAHEHCARKATCYQQDMVCGYRCEEHAAPRNAIQIHLGAQGWLATYTGPHAKRIGELFDTCTLPTPFTAQASLATVIAEVQARNPGVVVKHWNAA